MGRIFFIEMPFILGVQTMLLLFVICYYLFLQNERCHLFSEKAELEMQVLTQVMSHSTQARELICLKNAHGGINAEK